MAKKLELKEYICSRKGCYGELILHVDQYYCPDCGMVIADMERKRGRQKKKFDSGCFSCYT